METKYIQDIFEKSFPFWGKLPEDDKKLLLTNSRCLTFLKGANIHDGNECTGVILVKSGSLRLYMLSEEGKDITLYRLFPGDICMLSASCVIQSITFDVFVDAEENCECVIINPSAFSALIEKNPEIKIFTLETVVSRFSDVMWVMQQILFMSFDRRLAIFLLEEAAHTGSDTIKLTHEQIATYMGSAREVVSRMLKYFSSEKIVETSRSTGIKIIDKKRLREIAH